MKRAQKSGASRFLKVRCAKIGGMKAFLFVLALSAPVVLAHDSTTGEPHPHYDWSAKPPEFFLAQATTPPKRVPQNDRPAPVAAFEKFAPAVKVRWDERFLFIESNGLPAHNMMVGITAWQQQVPLPQNYTGANAWQIPLSPVPAREPASIKNRFLRGAIAIAVNGIPIFNPQNNRGEISAEIGELDEWGGHCGRADDYHYHAAPLHLQSVLGKALPIAYALDGYPIYGLTEPDGAQPAGLDSFSGHTTNALGYHYHAATKYPYVNGGFHGEVVEREGQADPQPHAQPMRPALPALRGAKITAFEKTGTTGSKLSYEVNGDKRAVLYALNTDGAVSFEFQNGREGTVKETYTRREGGAGQGGPRPDGERRGGPVMRAEGGQPPRDGGGRPRREGGGAARDGGRRQAESGATVGMDVVKKPIAAFVLTSPAVGADGRLPAEFTGDGSGTTPPLAWAGAPASTKSFAVVMDHLAPGDVVKSYWVLWDIPATATSLPKSVSGVGKLGRSFRGEAGYEPPHSQGPGDKTYVLTVYALSAAPQFAQQPREVTREVLLTAIKDQVLASASMNVVYAREGAAAAQPGGGERPRREGDRAQRDGQGSKPDGPSADRPRREGDAPRGPGDAAPTSSQDRRPPGGGGKGGAGGGLVKAAMTDTMKAEVYADNWFALYINGRLAVVDPIVFLPHNVVSVDLLPEYPMTIAIIAHDNADPKTGLEYGDHIGDAGLVLKFADGTVTDGTWKVKAIERGPLGGDIANPRVETEHRPANWFAPDFDDSAWENATVFTEQRVNPKPPYYEHDFSGAQFIWSKDLDLDNTVLFRKRIDKPGWTPRWTAQPAGPTPQP
jgi:phosphatidylethanolamine-binding protein (PEBP) family uncharacterized protein